MTSLAFAILAVALVPIGVWARHNATALVSPYLQADRRCNRERVLRRGGMACLVVAAGFLMFAGVSLW